MRDHLRGRGEEAELLDSRLFPSELGLTCDPNSEAWTVRLPGGRVVRPGEVGAVYWRCYDGIGAPALPDEEQAYIAANDARGLFESFLIRYPARWVNGWEAFQLHQTKPVQLARAAALGVAVPATVLTNDAAAVREFAERYPRSIFKPIQGGAHTRRVTPAHLSDDNLRSLALAPVTLQEEVGGTNVRAFVAGERVIGLEVRAEAVDFREVDDPEVLVHALPAEVERQCRAVARAMGLVWTGIDFRLTPGGRYVFLEANPSPMFLGFEARSGAPLTEALTAALLGE